MEHAMALGAAPVEYRKADDGWWYTKAEFEEYDDGDDTFWNKAEQAADPPSATAGRTAAVP